MVLNMLSFSVVSPPFYDGKTLECVVLAAAVPRIGEYVECDDFCGHVKSVYHDYRKGKKSKITVSLV